MWCLNSYSVTQLTIVLCMFCIYVFNVGCALFGAPSVPCTSLIKILLLLLLLLLAAAFSKNYSHSSTFSQTFTAGTVNICVTLHVVIDEVLSTIKALSKVKSTCSAGPDNIPGILLNKLAGPLTRPLTVLFQQLLFQKHIPLD